MLKESGKSPFISAFRCTIPLNKSKRVSYRFTCILYRSIRFPCGVYIWLMSLRSATQRFSSGGLGVEMNCLSKSGFQCHCICLAVFFMKCQYSIYSDGHWLVPILFVYTYIHSRKLTHSHTSVLDSTNKRWFHLRLKKHFFNSISFSSKIL